MGTYYILKNLQTPQHSTQTAEQILHQKSFEFQHSTRKEIRHLSDQLQEDKDLKTGVKEHFTNIKNGEIEKISSSSTCMERKTCNRS